MFKIFGKNKKSGKAKKRFELVEEGSLQIDEKYVRRNKDGDVKLIPFFWQFFRKGWGWLFLGFVLIQTFNIGNAVLIPYITKEFLNFLEVAPKNIMFNEGVSYVYLIVGVVLITQTFWFVASSVINRLYDSQKLKVVKFSLYNYVQKHSYKYYTENASGKLYSKINSCMMMFSVKENILNFYMYIILESIINTIIFFNVSKVLGIVLFTTMLFLAMSYFLFRKPIKEISKKQEEQTSKTSGIYIDCLTNFLNMKLFSSKNNDEKFLYVEEEKLKFVKREKNLIRQMFSLLTLFFQKILSTPVFFLLGLYLYSEGKIGLGDLSYTIFIYSRILNNFGMLFRYLGQDLDTVSEIRSALGTILQPHEIVDKEGAKKLKVKDGKIEFKDVSFSYNGKDDNVLKKFNLEIQPGQKVGIVGHSGSGKTTFMNLLLRFYDKQKGQILIDGQEIADITQDSLRNNISVVPQDAVLFNRTLKENVSYAKPNAKLKDLEVVAKKAHALKFIRETSKSWGTIVGERGIKLSGGQKQRIAIARAMLEDAPIIFLDEATSALDSETEAVIQDSFKKLMKGKTSIVVAHRLSTLKHLDRIIVMDKGKIVQDGTHAQLVKKKGIYKELWDKQVGGFVVE